MTAEGGGVRGIALSLRPALFKFILYATALHLLIKATKNGCGPFGARTRWVLTTAG